MVGLKRGGSLFLISIIEEQHFQKGRIDVVNDPAGQLFIVNQV